VVYSLPRKINISNPKKHKQNRDSRIHKVGLFSAPAIKSDPGTAVYKNTRIYTPYHTKSIKSFSTPIKPSRTRLP
jgi:hypothetical protein